MRDHHKRPLLLREAPAQVLGKPVNAFDIKMIGGLIEQDDIRIGDEHARKIDASTLPARKRTNTRARIKIAYQIIEDLAHARIGRPHIFGCVAQDACKHRCVIIKSIFLSKRSNTHTTRAQNTPLIRFDRAIKKPQQRRFPITILAHHADRIAIIDTERKRLEDDLCRIFKMNVFAT